MLRLDHVFFAMSGDVVGKLCWEDKEEYLDTPNFAPEWYNLVHSIIKSIYFFQFFPWLARYLDSPETESQADNFSVFHYMPKSVVLWLMPQGKVFDDFDEVLCTLLQQENTGLKKYS